MGYTRTGYFDNMTGISPPMQDVYRRILQVAEVDVAVMLLGESGTGKELAARSIHRRSPRVDGPFIAVNTGAIAPQLVHSELFGHVKGAFTGAYTSRKGRFELADGGTLFLDEISTMPEETQVVLLRVLEGQRIWKVGGKRSKRIDVRLICASNESLLQDMEAGRLSIREDLFHRLNVFVIQLPPLREHTEDIPLLVEEFIQMYNVQFDKEAKDISPETLQALKGYMWPGNVRELKNVIQRAVILCTDQITLKELPDRIRPASFEANDRIEIEVGASMKEIERIVIERTLRKMGGNKKETAKVLGISRKALYDKIARYSIALPSKPNGNP